MAYMKMIMVALTVVLMSWTTTTQAQGPGTCVQALIPCGPFLGTAKPPNTCCDPLKAAVKDDLACLCAAFKNPALAATYNLTQAMQLPASCGIPDAGPSLCSGGISSAPTSTPGASAPEGSTSSSAPPPAITADSKGPSSPSGNGAGKNIVSALSISSIMLVVTGLIF